jgi:hypothetical protein
MLAFMLPATEPITAEPASAGATATIPAKSANNIRRIIVFFIVKNSFRVPKAAWPSPRVKF